MATVGKKPSTTPNPNTNNKGQDSKTGTAVSPAKASQWASAARTATR